MYLVYGSYTFDTNATTLAMRYEAQKTQANIIYSRQLIFDVTGYLTDSTAAALSVKVDALIAALHGPPSTLALYDDSNNRLSPALIPNSVPGSGLVQITKGPDFAETTGAEYNLERKFTFTAETFLPVDISQQGSESSGPNSDPTSDQFILAFEETVEISEGRPEVIWRKARNGPPQRQLVTEQTTWEARQSGSAEGWLAYPAIPGPLWDDSLIRGKPQITRTSPDRNGATNQIYRATWTYEFESGAPLEGVPHLWA